MSTSPFADEWVRGKTAQDFDVLEHLGGRLLWPVKIQRLRAGAPGQKATWTEEPAYLHTLDGMALLEATERATTFFDERGLKIDDARHQPLWNEVEMHARVALALREATPNAGGVHVQKHTLEQLLSHKQSGIGRGEVSRLDDLLQVFSRFEDGKIGEIDRDLVIKVALRISEVRNLSPLVAIEGPEQDTCVVTMAEILASYLQGSSSAPSPASSPPARSRRKSSATSSTAAPTRSSDT